MPATHASRAHHSAHREEYTGTGPYVRLAVMTALSFAAMYALMYAMVDRFENVYNSINQVYMAGLMAASMVIIELAVMRAMYPSRAMNAILVAGGLVALGAFWFAIRGQAAVGDEQFLRSMIPHHAGAILMCGKAPVRDAEIRDLCKTIIEGQEAEIRQMKELLARRAQ
jgi:uncharacterized protein (DUF305 family)